MEVFFHLFFIALKKRGNCLSFRRKAVPLQADYYQKFIKGSFLGY